jgi:alpha-galactosidase
VNGSCTDATPPTGYYSWNNTSGFCAYDFPVDGIDYTTKYTALKFRIMQSALEAQNRTMLYSLCEWGMSDPFSLSLYLLRTGELTHDVQVSTKYGPGATRPAARGACLTTLDLVTVSF